MSSWADFAFDMMLGAWTLSLWFFIADKNNAGDIGWAAFCTVVFVICYWCSL